ncbi:hypothetical protein [Nitrosomonas sp. PY1]|uniref:hypothetical protein n=1 Tax=Nitrosomonas sp. PY1 TaxID=1803906 RepID=UPI001FC85AED|nr:hypothetical protein [Nitrosomonas sp. PY1]
MRFCRIIDSRRLIGGSGLIRGAYTCVCFTEAPLPSLQQGFVNSRGFSRYVPFGLMFDKSWVFARGGRPAIYQTDSEFEALPEGIRWRHVRYEPNADPPIDFMWEREWRLRDFLDFDPGSCALVMPDSDWAGQMIAMHNEKQDWNVYEYSTIMNASISEQYREGFSWRIYTLR